MKRKNQEYDYYTDRKTVEEIDFEAMLKDFQKQYKERRNRNKKKKNHKR